MPPMTSRIANFGPGPNKSTGLGRPNFRSTTQSHERGRSPGPALGGQRQDSGGSEWYIARRARWNLTNSNSSAPPINRVPLTRTPKRSPSHLRSRDDAQEPRTEPTSANPSRSQTPSRLTEEIALMFSRLARGRSRSRRVFAHEKLRIAAPNQCDVDDEQIGKETPSQTKAISRSPSPDLGNF